MERMENRSTMEWCSSSMTTFLFSGLPSGCEIAMDANAFVPPSDFVGISLIPPGVHLVAVSCVPRSEDVHGPVGYRSIRFVLCPMESKANRDESRPCKWGGEIVLFAWDPRREEIDVVDSSSLDCSDEMVHLVQRYENREFERNLVPYDIRLEHAWRLLTSHFSGRVLKRLQRLKGEQAMRESKNSHATSESDVDESTFSVSENLSSTVNQSSTAVRDPWMLPSFLNQRTAAFPKFGLDDNAILSPDLDIDLTHIPHRLPREQLLELSAEERQCSGVDKSHLLDYCLKSEFENDFLHLLGEYQCAFLLFLEGEELAGLHQWKTITSLVARSCMFAHEFPEKFLSFLETFESQLFYVPNEFLGNEYALRLFLQETFRCLFSEESGLLSFPDLDENLRQHLLFMRSRTQDQFQQDFTSSWLNLAQNLVHLSWGEKEIDLDGVVEESGIVEVPLENEYELIRRLQQLQADDDDAPAIELHPGQYYL